MIKAVLFDMDGILYDSERFYLEGNFELLRNLGYTGEQSALLEGVGADMDAIYRLYLDLLDNRIDLTELKAAINAYYAVHPIPYKELMFPKVKETVEALKAEGYLLACCSSSPYDAVVSSLQAMGIASCFSFVESGERLKETKPAPDIYLQALAALQLKPAECVVYEDSDVGIAAGKNAGLFVIAREDHRFGQKQVQADLLVKDAEEMADWIRKENYHAGNHQNRRGKTASRRGTDLRL